MALWLVIVGATTQSVSMVPLRRQLRQYPWKAPWLRIAGPSAGAVLTSSVAPFSCSLRLPLPFPPPLLLPRRCYSLPVPLPLPLSLPLPLPSLMHLALPSCTVVWPLVTCGCQLVQNPWMARWPRAHGAFAACDFTNIDALSATLDAAQAESKDGPLARHCWC